jgi:hypothetical protein
MPEIYISAIQFTCEDLQKRALFGLGGPSDVIFFMARPWGTLSILGCDL